MCVVCVCVCVCVCRFATEVRDLREERIIQTNPDCVTLLVHNIDELWTDADFYRCLMNGGNGRRAADARRDVG